MKQQIYTRCLKCNRKLKTIKAKQRGYGECCWKKHLKEQQLKRKTIFDILLEEQS